MWKFQIFLYLATLLCFPYMLLLHLSIFKKYDLNKDNSPCIIWNYLVEEAHFVVMIKNHDHHFGLADALHDILFGDKKCR